MFAIFFLGIVGCVLIYLGVITLNGTYKKWYLGPRVFPSQAYAYMGIPLGIVALEMCIIGLLSPLFNPDTIGWLMGATILPTLVISYILGIWRPKWITPDWVWWLEENYSHNIYQLIAEAKKDPELWGQRVSTQKGLEDWAREVAGEPRPKNVSYKRF